MTMCIGKLWPWLGAGVLCLLPVATNAELIVIYDSGDTQPIAPYLKSLQPAKKNTPKALAPLPQPPYLGPADIKNLLPLRSPGMTPGVLPIEVNARSGLALLAKGNPRPFFLIGADARSQQWLFLHRARLIEIGAVGMLVQAETQDDVQRMADLAQGLSITLGSASDIADALGIRHYPVLITAKGIEQ